MVTSNRLTTASLRALPQGNAIAHVLAAALGAVDPANAVRVALRRTGDVLVVGEQCYDLGNIEQVFIVGAGKAGMPMTNAASEVVGEVLTAGRVVVKEGHLAENVVAVSHAIGKLQFIEAAHPVPDARGVAATQQIVELLTQATERDLVIALISGGGSALLTQPVAGVSLGDLQQLTGMLLRSGASINEINTLRKHLDAVKGGGLARFAYPAQLATLILSDVVGSPLDVIASGPTVADPTTFGDALEILQRYKITNDVPAAVLSHLQRGMVGETEETLKHGDARLARVTNYVVGSNGLAATAAIAQAAKEGFHTLLLTTYLQGEAREAGRFIAAIGRELVLEQRPLPRPACIVLGGETTVTIRGNGMGGRNQELALASVADLAGLDNIVLVALATDGGDGPTDAAGAVVTGATLARAQALNLDPADFLARNDAYHFFATLGDLLLPGPTQTNVNDLTFLFAL